MHPEPREKDGATLPSPEHEGLVELFRNRPEMIVGFLNEWGVPLPKDPQIRLDDSDATVPSPKALKNDLVVVLASGKKRLAVVVEVQLARKSSKKRVWPLYLAVLGQRLRCHVCLIVVTIDEQVANWARKPIRLGPGSVIQPMVIGPKSVQVVVDPKQAKTNPELAVLSAMAHGQGDSQQAAAIAFAAYQAIKGLDDDRLTLYWDRVLAALSEAARTALEAMMKTKEVKYISDFAQRYFAQGEAKGEALAVLKFLEARNVPVPEPQRSKIAACTNPNEIDRWIRKAAVLTRVDELFEDELCVS